MEVLTQKKYQDHVSCSLAYKPIGFDYEFTKSIVLFRGEKAAYKFIEAILKESEYCKQKKKRKEKTL